MQAILKVKGPIQDSAPQDGSTYTSLSVLQGQLSNYKDYDSILIEITSPGGSVNEGFGMYDWIKSLKVPVETYGISQVGSIATAVFLAGEKRRLSPHCEFFIHLPYGGMQGTADEGLAYFQDVKNKESKVIDLYLKNTSVDRDFLLSQLRAQTALTSEQAYQMGFANYSEEEVMALKADFSEPTQKNTMDNKKRTILNRIMALFSDEVTALALTLTDGTAINLDSEGTLPEVGNSVTLKETGDPVADGTHELSDGKKIVTSAGKITEIIQPETTEDNMSAQEAQALKEQNEALQAKVTALEQKYEGEIQANASFRTEVTAMLKTITSKGAITRDEDIEEKQPAKSLTVVEEWTKKQEAKKNK